MPERNIHAPKLTLIYLFRSNGWCSPGWRESRQRGALCYGEDTSTGSSSDCLPCVLQTDNLSRLVAKCSRVLNFCYSSHCFSGCSFLKILLEIILKHLLLDRKTVPNQWRFIIWSGGVHTVSTEGNFPFGHVKHVQMLVSRKTNCFFLRSS